MLIFFNENVKRATRAFGHRAASSPSLASHTTVKVEFRNERKRVSALGCLQLTVVSNDVLHIKAGSSPRQNETK